MKTKSIAAETKRIWKRMSQKEKQKFMQAYTSQKHDLVVDQRNLVPIKSKNCKVFDTDHKDKQHSDEKNQEFVPYLDK